MRGTYAAIAAKPLDIGANVRVLARETHEPRRVICRVGFGRNPEQMHTLVAEDEQA